MCTDGGLERDILVAQLTTLVNEWDKLINAAPSPDPHEDGHRHGILLCRNHVARLIGVPPLLVEHAHH
jgi:hypothetical protein